jgi:hypothetical protein
MFSSFKEENSSLSESVTPLGMKEAATVHSRPPEGSAVQLLPLSVFPPLNSVRIYTEIPKR